MAVAAYASLVSLTHVLDNIHYRAQLHRLTLGVKHIETLQGKVRFLLDFVEVHSQIETQEMKSLWRKMAGVAREFEEMIDLHVVDELHCNTTSWLRKYLITWSQKIKSLYKSYVGISSFHQDMEEAIQKIDFIMKELSMGEGTKDVRGGKQPSVSVAASSPILDASSNIMVGFDEYLDGILDELTNTEQNLQIIPIVGIGGIGKTTLARNIFTNPRVVDHFDKYIWVTISQEYRIEQIFLSILGEDEREENGDDLSMLGERLHKKLLWRRYLIVMDDVWSTDVWDELKMFFPNDMNGSRVMITSRLSDVVASLGCLNLYKINFLNEDQSWNLFCQKTFAQEYCPCSELEEIGKNIAKSCRGLPIALVIIASLLLKSNMTQEYWEFLAENVNSFGNLEDEQHCLKILSLSYTNLPIHLKPCFLYMRLYSEDEWIDVSDMIKQWVVAGFIKSVNNKNLEEIAKEYFNDLVSRNLIFIRNWKINKKPKTCGIHDLLRDLCSRESIKESFTWTTRGQHISFPLVGECNICGHIGDDYPDRSTIVKNFLELSLISLATSRIKGLVCDACKMTYSNIAKGRVVRVIHIKEKDSTGNILELSNDKDSTGNILELSRNILELSNDKDSTGNILELSNDKEFQEYFVQPTQLRYLSADLGIYDIKFVFPSTLHLLWNLHTLIIDPRGLAASHPIILPSEVWKMPQLRHFKVWMAILPNPSIHEKKKEDFMIMKNLQTLSNIHNFKCTKEVLDRIPNLKTLKVNYEIDAGEETKIERPNYSLCNLAQLSKLKSLDVKSCLEEITFPKSLKKLVLRHYHISWNNMMIIGSLPCLEILELDNVGRGPEWNPVEGEFLQLKGLHISWSDFIWWRADAVDFPRLAWLTLKDLFWLEEIPLSIGDIGTLHTIQIQSCRDAIVESARQILKEQRSMGNESLEIYEIDALGRRYPIGDFESTNIQEDCDDS